MVQALLLMAMVGCTSAPAQSGDDVIRAMHDRYAGNWYTNLALVQTVTYYDTGTGAFDSARVWYESIRLPGTVRSDIAPLDAGNRQLYKDGHWIVIEADSVISNRPGAHPLLLLGFDVYVQPADQTIAMLERFGFDLSQLREDEWQGRPAYVVGDENRQFWIEQESLLFVRVYLRNPNSGAEREIRFEAYEPLGGGWIATEIEFMRDGRVDMHERYDYWTIDVQFEPSLFSLSEPSRPTWVRN